MTAEAAAQVRTHWTTVCRYDDIIPERGVAALVGGVAVAVFRTHDGTVFALSNVDPFSGASVLSRGIVGDRGGRATVASPIYKQVFELATGVCLDAPDVSVPTYPVRVVDGTVEVGPP
ncbi:MAG: nitrite reductase small subunit NirD [Pseudonocardiales bacterium]